MAKSDHEIKIDLTFAIIPAIPPQNILRDISSNDLPPPISKLV